MLKIVLVTLIFAISSLTSFAQTKHNDTINIIVDSLAMEKQIPIGNDGKFSSKNAALLFKLAKEDDLITLTKYSSPIIRVYSIYDLAQSFQKIPFIEIMKDHLNDTETVKVMDWEVPMEATPHISYRTEKVGDLFVAAIRGNIIDEKIVTDWGTANYKPYLKEKKDLQKMDSLLVCINNKLKIRDWFFYMGNDTGKGCYSCVRRQVVEKQNPLAALYLARYRRNQDINLILNNISDPLLFQMHLEFYVFQEFHTPKMFKYLSDNFLKYYTNSSYINVISGYKNTEALSLLVKTKHQIDIDSMSSEKKYTFYKNLTNSLQGSFTDIYAPLLFEVMEASPDRNPKVPKELWKIDSERTYNYLLKCIYSVKTGGYWGNYYRGLVFGDVLSILERDAPSHIDNYLNHNLQPNLLSLAFIGCMRYVYAWKKESYIMPMIGLIKIEGDKSNRDVEIKILESYNSPDANKELDKLYAEHPEFRPLPENEKKDNKILEYLKTEAAKLAVK
jgi:hypothetical protein